MLTVSVVIPTLNEEDYVGLLLADLRKQTRPTYEIIVVDAHSEDRTNEIVDQYQKVQFVTSERSVSRQRNKGAEIASGEILIFLDADTRVRITFVEDVLRDFEKHGLDIACPLYVPTTKKLMTQFVFWYVNIIFVLLQAILPSGAGPCIIVRRDIFGLQEGFKVDQKFEDMEWIRRVGGKFRFGIVWCAVFVSDRRFRTYGMFRMIVLYVLLSFLFTFGLFSLANRLHYSFGKYSSRRAGSL